MRCFVFQLPNSDSIATPRQTSPHSYQNSRTASYENVSLMAPIVIAGAVKQVRAAPDQPLSVEDIYVQRDPTDVYHMQLFALRCST